MVVKSLLVDVSIDPNYEQVKHRLSGLVTKTHKIVSDRFTTNQGLRF